MPKNKEPEVAAEQGRIAPVFRLSERKACSSVSAAVALLNELYVAK